MFKVFQRDVLLLEVLLSSSFIFVEVISDIHFLALVNFRIFLDFLRSFSSGNIVYTETNSSILSDVSALSNSFIF